MKRLFAIALLFAGLAARAQETPTVTARVEPDSIMIGDRFDYVIDVEKDLVQVVEFPVFDPRDGKIELVENCPVDTLERDGRRLKLRKRYRLAAFDEGKYNLGAAQVLYADKNILDTLRSTDSVYLEVATFQIDSTSQSIYDGSTDRLKKNIITEIAAVLAFSAAQNNDKVGCIFFSDRVEKFIPPKKGRSHILMIIRELIGFRPESAGTKLSEPVRFLTNVNKKRCTTFILSDFMDSTGDKSALDDALKIAGSKHDLVGIRVYDPRETELPDVGIVELKDAESGRKVWVDTSSRAVRDHYAASWQRRSGEIEATLKHNRIDTAMISTDGDYVAELIKLFKQR